MKNLFYKILFVFVYIVNPLFISGQSNAVIKESVEEFITYPFSDPNPNPVFENIYPYFRYEGFSTISESKSWKVVVMENDYLIVKIMPQIGGKIWSVIDKKTKKEMFYGNETIKFRDIALRGPWTSGGIEFNYGVIGHAPSVSSPIDYLLKNNEDGSVSCIIGALDLLTRTNWSVEINLPKDKAWFTTKSFWHNKTGTSQPYYSWSNAGVLAKDDLELVYPGTHIIGHDGSATLWPYDSIFKKDLTQYKSNDYIGAKSYHIVGAHTPYFGSYWKENDFGVIHYTNPDEKVGKKIFIWSLADDGKIWEELLTDKSGQYIELQSGRLFNQNQFASSLTPYKQFQFHPYSTEHWTEYWFPVSGIGGVTNVSLKAVLNIEQKNENKSTINIYPLQYLRDTLGLYFNTGSVEQKLVELNPAQPYSFEIELSHNNSLNKVCIGKEVLWQKEDTRLQRPVKTPSNFNWETGYGNYLKGRDLIGMRLFDKAEPFIKQSLMLDSNYIPALIESAKLYYHKLNFDSAFIVSKKALSIDTYSGEVNYEYGRAALKIGNIYDALDGFEIASLTPEFRSASFTEISKIYFVQKKYEKSLYYAEKSLINNQFNIQGLQLIYLNYSQLNVIDKADEILKKISLLDPLNHFVLFENYANDKSSSNLSKFQSSIKSEMPEQTYFELGLWFYSLNLLEKSKLIFSLSPQNTEIAYWIAYLDQDKQNIESLVKKASSLNSFFIFPFREESELVFKWATQLVDDWQPRYYLALLYAYRNKREEATHLLTSVKEKVPFSPFYSLRAQLNNKNIKEKENDLKNAISITPNEWRYTHEYVRFLMENKNYSKARLIIEPFYNKNKNHFPTGILLIRVLVKNKDYEAAEKILKNIQILPFEGAKDGWSLYRETKLALACNAIKKNKLNEAERKIEEAKDWPRNLGVGKPYNETINQQIEDWLSASIAEKRGDIQLKNDLLKQIAYFQSEYTDKDLLLQALALSYLGRQQEADCLIMSGDVKKTNTKRNIMLYEEWIRSQSIFDFEKCKEIITSINDIETLKIF